MRMKDRVVLAPMDVANSPAGEQTMASWEKHLLDSGLDVVPLELWRPDSTEDILSTVRGVIVPSAPIGIEGGEPVAMGHDALHAVQAALRQPINLFSERPVESNFALLRNRFPGDEEVRSFDQLVHELCETVIGQDVSIIQKELGVI